MRKFNVLRHDERLQIWCVLKVVVENSKLQRVGPEGPLLYAALLRAYPAPHHYAGQEPPSSITTQLILAPLRIAPNFSETGFYMDLVWKSEKGKKKAQFSGEAKLFQEDQEPIVEMDRL